MKELKELLIQAAIALNTKIELTRTTEFTPFGMSIKPFEISYLKDGDKWEWERFRYLTEEAAITGIKALIQRKEPA